MNRYAPSHLPDLQNTKCAPILLAKKTIENGKIDETGHMKYQKALY